MTLDFPNLEVGCGSSQLDQAFSAGADAARQAIGPIKSLRPSVAIVLSSVRYDLNELLSGVASVLGSVPTIGSTTSGEICGDLHHRSVVVTVLASPYLSVRCGIGRNVSQDWNKALDEALDSGPLRPFFQNDQVFWRDLMRSGKTVFAMLFSPGGTKNALSSSYEILEALKRRSLGRFPIVGGAAGDDRNMEASCVLVDKEAFPDSLAVGIFETQLTFGIAQSHCFGAPHREVAVTKTDGKEVLTLDNRPAADVYAELVGSTREALEGKHLTQTTGQAVGVLNARGEYSTNEACFFTPRGGILFVQQVPVGAVLTLIGANPETTAFAAPDALRKAMMRGTITNPAVAVIWYCSLRPGLVGDKVQEDLSRASGMLDGKPLVGFCSFVDQGVDDEDVSLHDNVKVSILVIGQELSQTALVALENDELRCTLEQKILERTKDLDKANKLLKESLQEMMVSEERNHHLNQVLKAIRNVNQLIVREHNIERLLADACNILVRTRGYSLVWIGQAKECHKRIVPVARAGKCIEYLDEIKITWDDSETGHGPVGMAMKTGRAAYCQDVASDPKLKPWREAALTQGFTSILAVPIIFGDRTFGILTVYADHPQAFDSEEIRLISELAEDLAFALQNLETEAERRRAEEALKESEERFRRLAENAQDIITRAEIFPARRISYVNQALARISGHTPDEFYSDPDMGFKLVHPDDRHLFAAYAQGGTPVGKPLIMRFLSNDGTYRWVEQIGVPVHDRTGNLVAIEGIGRDITERMRAEEALRESHKFLDEIINAIPISAFWKNRDLVFLGCNSMFAHDAGFADSKDIVGKDDYQMVWRDQAELYRADDLQVIESGRPKLLIEELQTTPDGNTIVLLTSKIPLRSPAGDIIGVLGTYMDITERKQAEKALQESEDMYRAIFENTGTAMMIIDENTIITLANSEFERLSGYDRDEVEGKISWMEFVAKEDLERMLEQHKLRRSDPDSALNNYEFRAVDRSGHTKDILLYVGAIPGTKKSIASLLDITERKRTEEELKKAQSRLRVAMDLAKLVQWEYDAKTDLFTFDDQFYTLYRTTAEREGGPLMSSQDYARKFLPAKEAPLVANEISKSLSTTDPNYTNYIEHRIIRGDGTEGFMAVRYGVVKDDKGNTVKTFGANQDITERKLIEKALQESKDYLDKIINSIGDPLFVKDRQHRITLVNDAACRLFGRQREDILGRTAYDLFSYEEMAEVSWEMDEEVFRSGAEAANEETITCSPDTTLTVLVKKTPYADNAGNQFLVDITRDITDRKQAEDRIIASLREKEALLKEIHHRVKNNLQIISSLLKIQSRYTKDKVASDVLKECHNRVRSMALIHESLYRSENLGGVNFAEYIRSLTGPLFSSFGVDRQQVNLKLDLDDVYISIDKAIPCGLIVNELLSNSLKHAFPGHRTGEICIQLKHRDADKVLLIVKDNGVGLPADLDIHESKTLGLRLVTDLVKQLKGNLQLNISSGTEFKLIFAPG